MGADEGVGVVVAESVASALVGVPGEVVRGLVVAEAGEVDGEAVGAGLLGEEVVVPGEREAVGEGGGGLGEGEREVVEALGEGGGLIRGEVGTRRCR
ncbi:MULTISPECIES: hypothetical protein [Kitasatospora]|uniref:hypothetical protein n=1 Tax=Kitasatospora TaxID=2063 RepID=UPI00059B62A2|nr:MULTISPECIES: hypothetical protein [Kitasatospora]